MQTALEKIIPSNEFAKLLGARALLWCLSVLLVIKIIKFLKKRDSHLE
jgi:hypothetical protein